MSNAYKEYWVECISIAAEECGANLTREQVEEIAYVVQGAHENYGMAFYSPPAGEHFRTEIDDLQRKLKAEREKVGCRACNGTGRTQVYFGTFMSDSQCSKCRGEGKHAP